MYKYTQSTLLKETQWVPHQRLALPRGVTVSLEVPVGRS